MSSTKLRVSQYVANTPTAREILADYLEGRLSIFEWKREMAKQMELWTAYLNAVKRNRHLGLVDDGITPPDRSA